jgi:heme-degrading monooxygenase HmoA
MEDSGMLAGALFIHLCIYVGGFIICSMIHQLRIYEIFEHNKAAFHERFREHAARIMQTYGFDILAMWEAQMPERHERTEFVYLLRWPNEPTMRSAWARFLADEEWKEIKRVTSAQHGDLVGAIEDRVLLPTPYSPSLLLSKQR